MSVLGGVPGAGDGHLKAPSEAVVPMVLLVLLLRRLSYLDVSFHELLHASYVFS